MSKEHVSKGVSTSYEPPCVYVVEVQVEKGFAASAETGGNGANWGHEDGEWE